MPLATLDLSCELTSAAAACRPRAANSSRRAFADLMSASILMRRVMSLVFSAISDRRLSSAPAGVFVVDHRPDVGNIV
jgi:hypothetical protein